MHPYHSILLKHTKNKGKKARSYFKGRVQCFSMQVVMNKCFLLNPEKDLALIRLSFYFTLIPKNDVIDPKARKLWQLVKLWTGWKLVSGLHKPWFPKAWTDL